jgi:hypothetical protein
LVDCSPYFFRHHFYTQHFYPKSLFCHVSLLPLPVFHTRTCEAISFIDKRDSDPFVHQTRNDINWVRQTKAKPRVKTIGRLGIINYTQCRGVAVLKNACAPWPRPRLTCFFVSRYKVCMSAGNLLRERGKTKSPKCPKHDTVNGHLIAKSILTMSNH